MKKLALLANALALAVTLFLTAGCDTPGRLLASTTQSVDAAMKGWNLYAEAHQTPEVTRAKVDALYGQYQMAELAAEHAFISYIKTKDKTAWESAAASMRACQFQLLQLINEIQRN